MHREITFSIEDQPIFKHRPPDEWLADVLRMARVSPLDYTIKAEQVHAEWLIHVTGTQRATRLVLIVLNLHADQTPYDTTPADQAIALEALWKDQPPS